MVETLTYIGNELELFATARHWKSYVARQVRPFLKGDILEVGAGIGGMTRVLCTGKERRWVCLEPDAELAGRMGETFAQQAAVWNGFEPEVEIGTLQTAAPGFYDALLYMDVLEHIEHDAEEAERALARLRPGGYLIILVPAHQWLFTPFDEKIGHFRRYNRQRLIQAIPRTAQRVHVRYLDSVGLLASSGNRLFLKASMPTPRQIQIWDGLMVPVSRLLDPLLGYTIGKSLLGIWRKPQEG